MNNLMKVTREIGMKINMNKMKVMFTSRNGNKKLKIYADGQVEQMRQFRYLGNLISEEEYCQKHSEQN